MSRTFRKEPFHYWKKEKKIIRRLTKRQFRHNCEKRILRGEYDDLPIRKGTEGWLTW